MMHQPLSPDRVHPQNSSFLRLLVICLVRPDMFVIYYCLFIFFKGLISFIGSLDKCHTSVFNALILPVFRTIVFSYHRLLFQTIIVETIDSGEKGMNAVANDYHRSPEKILVEPGTEPATSCSQVLYADHLATRARLATDKCLNRTKVQAFQCIRLNNPFPKQALNFTRLKYKSFENTVEKGEIAISPFSTVFTTLFG